MDLRKGYHSKPFVLRRASSRSRTWTCGGRKRGAQKFLLGSPRTATAELVRPAQSSRHEPHF